ncbi:MAG: sigma-E factor negative regulatory protein [Methylococcales bacterium]|nr:sigma-E factor negative regulatory protein [Methylococcales bacterium]
MPEELKQKISQFLDDELDQAQTLGLLKKIQSEPELQEQFKRYEAVSHALKTEVFLLAKTDFSTRIRQQIQQEPTYLLPQRKIVSRGHIQLAVAASIAVVALLVGRDMMVTKKPAVPSPNLQLAQQQATKPVASAEVKQLPLNKRINDYLQAHNNSVYTNGEANFQPYARVTAYSQK